MILHICLWKSVSFSHLELMQCIHAFTTHKWWICVKSTIYANKTEGLIFKCFMLIINVPFSSQAEYFCLAEKVLVKANLKFLNKLTRNLNQYNIIKVQRSYFCKYVILKLKISFFNVICINYVYTYKSCLVVFFLFSGCETYLSDSFCFRMRPDVMGLTTPTNRE